MSLVIKDIRLWNARYLADQLGSIARFAESINKNPGQVGQFIGQNPTKAIGHKIAREIEEHYDHETGWLDKPHLELWGCISKQVWRDQLSDVVSNNSEAKVKDSSENSTTPEWCNWVKNRMKEIGVAQYELIEPLGVSTRGAIGHYLSGRREMSPEQLLSLAKELKCTVSDILGDSSAGVIDSLETDELALLGLFRKLNTNNKKLAIRLMSSI